MQKELYLDLLKTIHKYYPLGGIHHEGWDEQIREIVGSKIDALISNSKNELLDRWKNLITGIRNKGFEVHDCSYLQFPNLSLVIAQTEEIGQIKVCRNFTTTLSLLCPYYTYFYEYRHQLHNKERMLQMGSYIFLSNEEFQELKIPFAESVVKELMVLYYPEYQYVYHYHLMLNTIKGGIPFGDPYSSEADHSIYEFLFGNDQQQRFPYSELTY